MDWETTKKLPWGMLILLGGGLSLADAIKANGVGEFLGSTMTGLSGAPDVLLVMAIVATVIFLTEITSNTATTATFVPILISEAPILGMNPVMLAVPAGVAASCAFMLPVATPPNALVYASGRIAIRDMMRSGIWLNLIGVGVITVLTYLVVLPLLV